MKPLPKGVGYIAAAAGVLTAAQQAGIFAFIPESYRVWVLAVVGGLLAFTHSFTGTGGTPANP